MLMIKNVLIKRSHTCKLLLSITAVNITVVKPLVPKENPQSKEENELTNSTHMKRLFRKLNQLDTKVVRGE